MSTDWRSHLVCWFIMIYLCWLVFWNMNCYFPYIGNNNPNWRTHVFQRGWNHQPENDEVKHWDLYMTLLLKFQFLVSGTMCHKSLPMKIRTFFLETCDVFQDIFSGNMRCVSCSTVLGSKVIEVKHVAFEPFEFSGKYTKNVRSFAETLPGFVSFFWARTPVRNITRWAASETTGIFR